MSDFFDQSGNCSHADVRSLSAGNHITIGTTRGVAVIDLSPGSLADALVMADMEQEILDFIELARPQKVVICFDAVSRCVTSSIHAMLRVDQCLAATDGELKLCGMRDVMRECCSILKLDGNVFEIHDSPDDAISEFAPPLC